MLNARTLLLASLVAFVTFAGCLADDEPVAAGDGHADDGHSHSHDGMDGHAMESVLAHKEFPPFQIDMQGCTEAGGISIYNSQVGATGPTRPFVRANNLHDVGAPTIGTYGTPITSEHTTGIWHMAGQCDSYTINGEPRDGEFRFGWVGVKVEQPEFMKGDMQVEPSTGPAYQYFITDLSFMDKEVVDYLRNEIGIHASLMLEGGALPLGPAAVNVVMNDEDHGIFETHMTLKDNGMASHDGMRQWLYIPADGDLSHGHSHDASGVDGVMYQPVSLDYVNHGAITHEVSTDGTGWFSHSRTNHHGTGPTNPGGAAGNLPGLRWDGFDRTLTLGPIPDTLYDQTWLH